MAPLAFDFVILILLFDSAPIFNLFLCNVVSIFTKGRIFRLNRYIFLLLAAIALCAVFLFCERHDVISGAGEGVVTDMDSSLTDTRKGFALINLDAGAADSAFSLPASADPAFSTQIAGYAIMGVNRHGDTLASHTQFRAAAFAAGRGTHPYGHRDSLAGAHLYFRAIAGDTSLPTAGVIAVYPSDTLTGVLPVNRADKGEFLDEEGAVAGDARIGEFTPSGGTDSIALPRGLAQAIFDARISSDSSVFHAFAFSIVDYHGYTARTQTPYVIVHIVKDGKDVRDSIVGLSRFTAFERAAAERAAHPYSSQHTLRTAVFRVNVGRILDTLGTLNMAGARGELINAVAAIRHWPAAEGEGCEAGGCVDLGEFGRLGSSNIGSFRMFALDTLITDGYADSAANSLSGRFSVASPTTPASPHNVFSVRAALRSAIANQSSRPGPYIYIYLRPTAENSAVLWDRPLMVETIFTPSRSE